MERALSAELVPSIAGAVASELGDFDSVVRVYRAAIFRFILASLREREAAEDLTQECFFKAYQARERFRGDASVKTWLMHIAVNLVRNHLTNMRLRFWRRTQRCGVDPLLAGDWLADGRGSPEAVAHAKQQVAAVWDVAAGLSQRQRSVFLLTFVEDMDLLEIAAATGMKEGTVKAHLFRALESVRLRIEERK